MNGRRVELANLGRRGSLLLSLSTVAACTFGPAPSSEMPDTGVGIDVSFAPDASPEAPGLPDAEPTDTGPDIEPDGGTNDTGGPLDAVVDAGDSGPSSDVGLTDPDAAPVFADAGGPCFAAWTYVPQSFDPCAPIQPPVDAALDLGSGDWRFNTDDASLRDSQNQLVRQFTPTVLLQVGDVPAQLTAVEGITVAADATLTVVGEMPWILAVYGEGRILGGIFAENGNDMGCSPSRDGSNAPLDNGSGGGGGGGHGALGGRGGTGRGTDGAGGIRGPAVADTAGPPLRPGCSGGRGGDVRDDGDTVATGGDPGVGGGAIQISVRDRLSIEGAIYAVGQPGLAGRPITGDLDDEDRGGSGGGGGGSGGDIVLESSDLFILGQVCAGGGAGGTGANRPDPGEDGLVGSCQPAIAPTGSGGQGGTGSIQGPGGNGAQAGIVSRGGGGGGGGGHGRIQLKAQRAQVRRGPVAPTPR